MERDVQIHNFAFAKSSGKAPNPRLKLSGVGLLGLPLSERDAGAIREVFADKTMPGEQSSWDIPSEAVC